MVGYLRQAHQFAKTPAGGRTGHKHRQRLGVRLATARERLSTSRPMPRASARIRPRRARSCKMAGCRSGRVCGSGGQDQVIDAQRLHAAAARQRRHSVSPSPLIDSSTAACTCELPVRWRASSTSATCGATR